MTTNERTRGERSWQLLLVLALFAWLVPQQTLADKLYSSSGYSMSTYSDHISVKLLVADLVGRDSWLVADSRLKAYSGSGRTGTSYNLVNVYSYDQDGNSQPTHDITACYDMHGAVAILTNAGGQQIAWSRTNYTIRKQGDYDYPQAEIDFYWGPQMAGRTWYIYFESKHDNGATTNFYLGTVDCSDMRRNALATNGYEYERTGARKVKFTTPALPASNAGNSYVQTEQIQEAWYNLTLDYTRYDGSTFQQTAKVDCGTAATPHDIEIPEEVGNFKSVEMQVEAVDALKSKDTGEYFYQKKTSYLHKNCLPSVPIPTALGTEYHQFDSKTDLMWTTYVDYGGAYNFYKDCKPIVYRIETDAKGESKGGQWTKCGTLPEIGTTRSMGYSDKRDLTANKYYRYIVVNVPSKWMTDMSADLTSPSANVLAQLGYCQSGVVSTAPTMSIHDLQQDPSDTKHVKLQWQYSRVPVSATDATFEVLRSKMGENSWTSIASQKFKANPEAGFVATYTDANVESTLARYDYMVTVSINSGVNKFESNVVTGSLLSGTTIRNFDASKGNHQNSVQLQWQADQVGTSNTQYDIYRRYVDAGEDEWMKIHTTSGTGESYTYEDNTVQPGYYYQYRVEAYYGEKAQNTTELSTKTAIGFCQARGTVSGRVTFSNGNTSVADVRVTLQPGEEGGDNAVKSYAQRVSGASTGIAWNASDDELAKVFGSDKDFTVQMFVRPDTLLSEGAVIGEIPGEGRLVLGNMQNGEYELMLEKATGYVEPKWVDPILPKSTKTTDLSKLTDDYVATNAETLTGKLAGGYKISIADGATVYLKDVTIEGVNSNLRLWAGITCQGNATIILEGKNTVKGFYHYFPGILIVLNKTLTIKGTGSLDVSSNGYAPGIGGVYVRGNYDGDPRCGNIVIEGGIIKATGSSSCAGIGGAPNIYYPWLNDDITITGGEITAIGGSYSPAIGTGCNLDLHNQKGGSITITNTVTSVSATSGGFSKDCIGKGYHSTCGTVTIGGVVYWDGNAYQNGAENTIQQKTYTHFGDGSWATKFQQEKEGYTIPSYLTYGSATATGVKLPSSKYALLTVSRTGDNLQFQVDGGEAKTLTATKYNSLAPFSVGGSDGVTDATAFKGNLAEVRVWDHALTDKEKENYNDRVLSGRETGLKLYWPMDEGKDRLVFDASYSNDQPNSRHATVGPNITSSNIVPADNQLSRYGVTNANGEYTIRGIPFVGSGSSYTFIPTKGIHEFTPVSRNGFISPGSLTLNSIDFSDQSSFPLSGTVTYLDTNIPVDSVSFKVDGVEAQGKNGVIYTDANGQYEISVPIGNHRIEAYRKGHRLTTMPMGAGTYDFMQAEVCNFVDSTLVNVTGRVNGGFSDKDAPVGFGLSKNRIGQATLKLSLGRTAQSSFNYITDAHGRGTFGTTKIDVKSATTNINSTAWRAAGTADDNTETHYIYIKTDPKTGEFSAMLPPLKYQVDAISFDNDTEAKYNNLDFFTQNLPLIDATRAKDEELKQDSLVEEGQPTKYFKYSAKMIRQLRVEPSISVEQSGMKNGAFGIDSIEVVREGGAREKLEVVKYDGDKYTYNFGYPLFQQGDDYEMTVSVAEKYYNVDTKETVDEIPQDAQINITNEGSVSASIVLRDTVARNTTMQASTIWKVPSQAAAPSEHGHVKYTWTAGYPNLTGEFLRNLYISVTVDKGRTTPWKAPNSKKPTDNSMPMIVLGSIVTGTNFVSGGPDHVDMILRRPPGSTSYAQLATDTIYSDLKTTEEHSYSKTMGGTYVSTVPKLKQQIGVPGATKELEINTVLDENLKAGSLNDTANDSITGYTYTVSQAMKTPSSDTYTQNNGDTYIGRATNTLFGKGFAVGLFKQKDGSYAVDRKSSVCTSKHFGTTFVYSQQYVEDVLIPNWRLIRNNFLTYVDDTKDDTKAKKVPGKVMYYTSLDKNDPKFGTNNNDLDVWTQAEIDATNCRPSYRRVDGMDDNDLNITDSVEWCNKQIKMWQDVIAQNEKDKLTAFDDDEMKLGNFSIAGGTMVSQSHKNSRTMNYHETTKDESVLSSETHGGLLVDNLGMYIIVVHESQSGTSKTTTNDSTFTRTVNWQMSDAEPTTALSVDVFESPKNWGPIFRTRGGQTSNPYEDATYTKYYQKGTKLDEATMRVEKPELRVDGASTATNVPTGGQAIFNLELINASETDNVCTYVLAVNEKSNENGAILTVDGNILSNGKDGRAVKMKAKETIKKQLVVQQSDRNITDYKNITLVLKSQKDTATVSDPVQLTVLFRPTSAVVDMSVNHTVLNSADMASNNGVLVSFKNLDHNDQGLAGLRLRYRKKSSSMWHLAQEWKTSVEKENKELNEDVLTTSVHFPEDGLYELQGQTYGMFGNEEVTYETDIIEVTQDTRGPKLLGTVSPENGQLNWLNRNNMHVRFNEELNSNGLSKSDNFTIEGGMNNVVAEKGRPYPDVALQLTGDSVSTESMYDLSGTNFALDLWLYRQGDGKIISLGTNNNLLSLSTHDGGLVSVCLGTEDNIVDALETLPLNKWVYVAMDYKQRTDAKDKGLLTLLYSTADANSATYIFQNQEVEAVSCHGKLAVGGSGMTGRLARVSVWNSDVTALKLYEKRQLLRAPYTPGLIGYWKMDEGHGTQVTDVVRSRHIQMPSESWYINNRNLAAHLDGSADSPLKLNVATFVKTSLDNFAYEMWFRGAEKDNKDATLMSAGKDDNHALAIGFDGGKLTLRADSNNVTLSEQSYLDGNWHHLALNVRRGISAIAYVDGEAVRVMPESTLSGIQSTTLTVGANQTGTADSGRFTGDVDEIRLWSAALDGQLIKERMYERMDSTCAGLDAYFPMENVNRNEQSTVVTTFSKDNFGDAKSQVKITNDQVAEAQTAPALKVGSSRMQLADTQYDFTASADEIYFSFSDKYLSTMDGNDFTVTVKNIADEHGNVSEPVAWQFHADFASLKWNMEEETLSKPWNEAMEWQVYIANQTSTTQNYEISGLPTWLTVDKQIGSISGDGGSVLFRMGTDVPVGRHTEYIYLTDQQGISRVLRLNLTVTGNAPTWTVDPDLYESSMTLTGQIYINDKICENTDTKIAVFDDLGLCRGVASPKYVSTRDAYYVDMVIYGASATELSSGTRNLTFKVYDASTGTIHPMVSFTIPGKSMDLTLVYTPDVNYGSYDAPVLLDVANALEQPVTLAKGWTWMSIYVEPLIEGINWLLPRDTNILKRFKNIKSQTAFSSVDKSGIISGEVTNLEPGKMYKMQLSTKTEYSIIGMALDAQKLTQTMNPGYNWIGTVSSSVMSVDEAFAELQPEPGDRVKDRTTFAEFSTKGYWEGTLESIVPGQGYIYRSKADKVKTFHYPTGNAAAARSNDAEANSSLFTLHSSLRSPSLTYFTPVDPYQYPDNINVIAVVKTDGQVRTDAEVAAFIDGECRGAIGCNNGYYFLTAMGSSEDDSQKRMELRVYVDAMEFTVDDTLPFISDACYGSLDEPYVLDIDLTAIRTVQTDEGDDGDWWTLQGYKIGRRPTQPGVYIHHGQKVRIGRK